MRLACGQIHPLTRPQVHKVQQEHTEQPTILVIVAREFDRDVELVIASQPTRGIDVGSIEYIHGRIVEERDKGAAVLIVSSELEEVMGLSDRILVMFEGRVAGEFDDSATATEIGLAMLGSQGDAGSR